VAAHEVGQRKAEEAAAELVAAVEAAEGELARRAEETAGLRRAVAERQQVAEAERTRAAGLRGEVRDLTASIHRSRGRLKERDETIRRIR
jgi:hypothetical protein